jgi:hypothetical protein
MNKIQFPNNNRRPLFALAAALILILAFILATAAAPLGENEPKIEPTDGVFDLRGLEFSRRNARLSSDWDFYAALYSPEDFAAAEPPAPTPRYGDYGREGRFATYRAILLLDPGEYALSGYTLDYATRIFIDGAEVLNAGTVADNRSGFVPRVERFVLPVISGGDPIEIVAQCANYSHYEGLGMWEMNFGLFANIQHREWKTLNSSSMLGGALLLFAVFYLALFLAGQGLHNLAFALCCAALALRDQLFLFALLPRGYDWNIVYRVIYIDNIAIGALLPLLVYSLYPEALPRPLTRVAVWGTAAATFALSVTAALLPLETLSRLVAPSYPVYIPAILYIVAAISIGAVRGKTVERVTAAGAALLFSAQFADIMLQGIVPEVTRGGLGRFGMIAFVVCFMLAFSIRSTESAVELDRERKRLDFYHRMAHDLLTPLTRVSTNVQMADMQPETAAARLADAQADIMFIAGIVQGALSERRDGDAP